MAGRVIENITELLGKLRISDSPATILKELKVAFSALQIGQLENIFQNLNISGVFDCLNTSNRDQLETACELLKLVLSGAPPAVVIRHFHEELKAGLSHPNITVKELMLIQLNHIAQDEEAEAILYRHQDIIVGIVKCMADDEISIAKQSQNFLQRMGKLPTSREIFFSPWMIKQMKDTMAKSDIVRYRMYEVIVAVSSFSSESLLACVQADLITPLIEELDTADVLVQLNCIHLVTELAASSPGLQYLEQNDILISLQNKLQNMDNDPLSHFVVPGLIKFFGSVCAKYPAQLTDRFMPFAHILFKHVHGNDPILQGVAVETVGHIGKTVPGKKALDSLGTPTVECVTKLGQLIKASPDEIRVRAISSVASLVETQESEMTNDVTTLVENWVKSLHNRPMELVVGVCQQPFADLRLAMFNVVIQIARYPWGQQMILNHPSFLEFLLDRSTESDKQGKEAKYAVVEALRNSPTSSSILGADIMDRIIGYYKEGPFFVRVQAEVAIESAS